MSRKEGPRQAFVLMKTCWRRLEDVFSVASFHLSRRLIDILDYEKSLRIIITKTENRFVILLDFGYVLYHFNDKGFSCIPMTLLNACVEEEIKFTNFALIGLSMKL